METSGFHLGDFLTAEGDHIRFPGTELCQARALLWDDQEGDGLELRDAFTPMALHGFELDGGAHGVLRDLVGAAADRISREPVSPHLLKIFLGDHHPGVANRTRKVPGEEYRWLLQMDNQGMGVFDLSFLERCFGNTQE